MPLDVILYPSSMCQLEGQLLFPYRTIVYSDRNGHVALNLSHTPVGKHGPNGLPDFFIELCDF